MESTPTILQLSDPGVFNRVHEAVNQNVSGKAAHQGTVPRGGLVG